MKLPQPIQYQGSKRLLAPLILRYVPGDAGRLVEPFAGTGALSIAAVARGLVRVMFYYPNRAQAMRIQQTLESLYKSVQGEYHYADAAWEYVARRTGVDLLGILKELAAERTVQDGK